MMNGNPRPVGGTHADMMRLDGRAVLVTGASRGLGRGFAQALADAGARVALAARDEVRLRTVASEMHTETAVVVLDVTDRKAVADGFDAAEAALGPIGAVVNNSGIAVGRRLLETTEEDWRTVVDTNLTGAWFVAQEAARRMAARRAGGSIVNVGSLLGSRTGRGSIGYAASKAGLHHLTRTMAYELAHRRIRVNALSPGYVLTDLNRDFFASPPGRALADRVPFGRLGEPADLVGPLLFLVSDASAYVTGQILAVDGGHGVSGV